MKMQIELVDIGRTNYNESLNVNIKTNKLIEAVSKCELYAYKKVGYYLLSKIVQLVPDEADYTDINTYRVCVGEFGRVVGKVIIRRIK